MHDQPLQKLLDKAWKLKKIGERELALACYNDCFELLSKEAGKHARNQDGAVVDIGTTRRINPKLFEEVKYYLKRDKTSAVISNNMGVIYAELGDYKKARQLFEQAIDLTPGNIGYPDPHTSLKELQDEYSS